MYFDSQAAERPATPNTVYTIRLSTGSSRGASLDDLSSGVQVCLMGCNNHAMMHRIAQVEDDSNSYETMEAICQVRYTLVYLPHLTQLAKSSCCNYLDQPAHVLTCAALLSQATAGATRADQPPPLTPTSLRAGLTLIIAHLLASCCGRPSSASDHAVY